MKLKKLFAGILAVAMMATMAAPAFAAGSINETITEENKMDTISIDKKYTVTTEGTTAPDETFQLKQVSKTYDNKKTSSKVESENEVPNLPYVTGKEDDKIVAEASYTETGTAPKFTISLPKYDYVGVYTYTLQEVDNATAGVDYQAKQFELTVYAFQGKEGIYTYAVAHEVTDKTEKVKDVANSYTAGSLTVKKEVTGELGEQDRLFHFTVVLTAPNNKTVKSAIGVSADSNTGSAFTTKNFTEGENTLTIEFDLKHDDEVTISNIPYGVTYTVKEAETDGYTAKVDNKIVAADTGVDGDIAKVTSDDGAVFADADKITFVNNKGGNVDTGVILDNAPYIALMMVVVAGAAVMVIKKRRHYED